MDGNLVTGHILILHNVGARNNAGSNNEEGRFEAGLVHVVE